MQKIEIDLETYSSADLSKCGVYKYTETPDFEILLFGYSVDGGPVKVVDLAMGEEIPEEILEALTDERVIKWAHNAQFERICLSRFLRDRGLSLSAVSFGDEEKEPVKYLNPEGWHCTMTWAAYMGLPLSLMGAGIVLGLDKKKMEEGKELIRFFCVPRKPTKTNSATRNRPEDAPDKWAVFKEYNIRDVEVEMEIAEKLERFPVPDFVWDEYCIDQEINDRGVALDMTLVRAAIEMDGEIRDELKGRMQEITEVDNPNSVQQLTSWLGDNGLEVDSLGKKDVRKLVGSTEGDVKEVLQLRQQLAKSSVKKYQAMENAVCADGRARGMFQFYGANRTGRFAGRLIQMQNLPQNHLSDLAEARALVRSGDIDAVKMLYEDVPDTLSQLIRTAFVPKKDNLFYVADFSAIEARVLSWLAGEEWRMEVFEQGGDIYCATASRMFGVPVEKHGVNSDLRQKGKQAELACGYGGGVGAMIAMGAVDMGIPEEELDGIVKAWRSASPNIVRLWWNVDRAAKTAIKEKTTTTSHGLKFSYQSGFLFITLPSGRNLAYVKPRMGENKFGGESITYEGVGATKKWERLETYGPKIIENVVQGLSRDILMYAMKTLRHCSICMHIHDELVIEASPKVSLEVLCEQMGRTPPWTPGLVLRADGYITPFYKKD